MIVVKLMGGLGNQMFQYALGRKLSIKYNQELKLDNSFLLRKDLGENFTYRDFDLDFFNLDCELTQVSDLSNFVVVNEPNHSPDLTSLLNQIDYSKNIYLDGFFQKEVYFSDIRNVLLKDFEITITEDKIKELQEEISRNNSVCINIRRGDYVSNKNANQFHGFYGKEYVQKGILELSKKIENPSFYIFSDEIDWCITNLEIPKPHTFVNHSFKGYKFSSYLKLMSLCKNFIIPNSTFAWWATWLNTYDNKNVFVPQKWYNVDYMDTSGLIPKDWNKI